MISKNILILELEFSNPSKVTKNDIMQLKTLDYNPAEIADDFRYLASTSKQNYKLIKPGIKITWEMMPVLSLE